jgi:hypothetical protein
METKKLRGQTKTGSTYKKSKGMEVLFCIIMRFRILFFFCLVGLEQLNKRKETRKEEKTRMQNYGSIKR